MEKIANIINKDYYWDESLKLSLRWADMALDEGTSQIEVIGYLFERITGYRRF